MKVILPSSRLFNIITNEQAINKNLKYRKIHFCYLYVFDETYLAYNVLTKELLELTKREYEILNNENIEPTLLSEELIKKHFLVPLDFDELKLNDQLQLFVKAINNKQEKSINSYTILTTTDCNARCFYCYQLGTPKIHMSAKTAEDVAEFILKNCNGKKVKINWFGGEPLYNVEPIDIICHKLSDNNVDFYSNMVSNAYLFTNDVVIKAKENWNLKKVQITLDGTEDVYNARKRYIYKDIESPYKTVMNNIRMLIDHGITPVIRLNIDLENKDDLYNLVEELYDRFNDCKSFTVYAGPIFDYNEKSYKNQHEYLQRMSDEYFLFQDFVETKFKSNPRPLSREYKSNRCMADSDSSVMVMPDGNLGKCAHYVGEYCIGDVYGGITNIDVVNELKEVLPRKELCKTCPLLPQCRILKICSHAPIADCGYYVKRRNIRELERSIKKEYYEFIGKKSYENKNS